MYKDFTIATYKRLLHTLIAAGYTFQLFVEYLQQPAEKVIILRHDIDDRKNHALTFSHIQQSLGITGTYYFRMVPQSYNEVIIRKIAAMGHEIGYHYEDLDMTNGDLDKAYEQAVSHLKQLRKLAKVKTICMHGSPRSPYDNRDVWKKYDYRELGIIGEPYFDLDFSKVLYLTDTGRRWDGHHVSVRDSPVGVGALVSTNRVNRSFSNGSGTTGSTDQNHSTRPATHSFKTTFDIIRAVEAGSFPDQAMINMHPQRWTDHSLLWTQELIAQNIKNVVKRALILYRKRNSKDDLQNSKD